MTITVRRNVVTDARWLRSLQAIVRRGCSRTRRALQLAAMLPGLSIFPLASDAAQIYVINHGVESAVGVGGAISQLTALGYTVDTGNTLADYGAFDQVWDLRYQTNLVAADVAAFESFLQGGGRVYLTGENPSFDALRNSSLRQLLADIGAGTLAYGTAVASNTQTFTPAGAALRSPNEFASLAYIGTRTITDTGTGFLVTESSAGSNSGSMVAWDFGDIAGAPRARMIALWDIDVFRGTVNGTDWTENMASFLGAPLPAIPEPRAALLMAVSLLLLGVLRFTSLRERPRGRDARGGSMMVRHLAGVLVATALCSSALGAQLYRITDLGSLPGGFGSQASAVNNSGQVVGHVFAIPGTKAFIWDATRGMRELDGLPAPSFTYAQDINDAGDVVGHGTTFGSERAIHWPAGSTAQDLGLVTGFRSAAAFAIGNNGHIVGNLAGGPVAFIREPAGSMKTLGALPGGQVLRTANDVNAHGDVVGRASTLPNDRAYIYSAGGATDLGVLLADDTISEGTGINDHRSVVGNSGTTTVRRAFIWDAVGGMRPLGSLNAGHDLVFAYAINNAGAVVGASGFTAGPGAAFIWTQTEGMLDLNDLVDPLDPLDGQYALQIAYDINAAGQIVGIGQRQGGSFATGFLLTPVPAPAVVWLMLAGIATLALRFARAA